MEQDSKCQDQDHDQDSEAQNQDQDNDLVWQFNIILASCSLAFISFIPIFVNLTLNLTPN